MRQRLHVLWEAVVADESRRGNERSGARLHAVDRRLDILPRDRAHHDRRIRPVPAEAMRLDVALIARQDIVDLRASLVAERISQQSNLVVAADPENIGDLRRLIHHALADGGYDPNTL